MSTSERTRMRLVVHRGGAKGKSLAAKTIATRADGKPFQVRFGSAARFRLAPS